MGISYKNIWSLNTDEAVVTGIIRRSIPKEMEVFMPANAQLKDTDLLIMNLGNKKSATMQVKGSRAYEPSEKEVKKYGFGSGGWFLMSKSTILDSKTDYFSLLIYIIEEAEAMGRRLIKPHIIIIPTQILKERCLKYQKAVKGDRYNIKIWINPNTKRAFEVHNNNFDFTDFLNKNGINKLILNLS